MNYTIHFTINFHDGTEKYLEQVGNTALQLDTHLLNVRPWLERDFPGWSSVVITIANKA